MSDSVFPTFPGLDIQVKRTPIFETTVQQAKSGKELRASWRANPRYAYKLKLNVLRSATALQEVQTLLNFFEQHRGRWDSFLFNDPYDAVQRRVRFDQDKLEAERIAMDTVSGGGHTWQVSVDLISVL
jgi:hypothetical protein